MAFWNDGLFGGAGDYRGGITFGFTESWTGVIIWEIVVFAALITALVKGGKGGAGHHADAH